MPTPFLSIIIPHYNEPWNLVPTVRSILDTIGDDRESIEIIIIDDGSIEGLKPSWQAEHFRECAHILMRDRQGCAPSRDRGAMIARGEWLLLIDAHMKFEPGWFQGFMENRSKAKLIGCNYRMLNEAKEHVRTVYGADFNWFKTVGGLDICDLTMRTVNYTAPITCVVGAAYFIKRNYYKAIDGLNGLHYWGGDEQLLSLKYQTDTLEPIGFIGDACKIGHICVNAAPNRTERFWILYNKLFIMRQFLPDKLYFEILKIVKENTDPIIFFQANSRVALMGTAWQLTDTGLSDFCRVFKIQHPDEIFTL